MEALGLLVVRPHTLGAKEQLVLEVEEEEQYLLPSLLTEQLEPPAPGPQDLLYYLTFSPFLPDSVFHLLACRLAAWSGGSSPAVSRRGLALSLPAQHSLHLAMQPLRYSRVRYSRYSQVL